MRAFQGISRSGHAAVIPPATSLCVETRGREIMAVLVHDVVADAMRLGLYDKPAERVVTANGAAMGRRTAK